PPAITSFPYTTLFRSTVVGIGDVVGVHGEGLAHAHLADDLARHEVEARDHVGAEAIDEGEGAVAAFLGHEDHVAAERLDELGRQDRKSTRLNSSHVKI